MQFDISYKKFRQGKRRVFNQVYDAHAGAMYGICLRYANCDDDAQEMLQEGFIRVYEKRELLKDDWNISGWIKKIMIHSCIDYLRKNKRMVHVEDDSVFEGVESEDDDFEDKKLEQEMVLSEIQKLPDGYRAVFNMFVLENLTHKEIASYLEISENTSKSQLRKAKIMLRENLMQKGIRGKQEIYG